MRIIRQFIGYSLLAFTLVACHHTVQKSSFKRDKLATQKSVPARYNSITAINPDHYQQAYEKFLQRAKAGDPIAQFNLGRMYADGRGVEVDDDQAFAWFQKAARNGYPEATLSLGVAYLFAKGTQKNPSQACKLFKQVMHQGEHNGREFYSHYCV